MKEESLSDISTHIFGLLLCAQYAKKGTKIEGMTFVLKLLTWFTRRQNRHKWEIQMMINRLPLKANMYVTDINVIKISKRNFC